MEKKNIVLVTVVVLALAAVLAWFFLMRKPAEVMMEDVADVMMEDVVEINNTVQTAVTVLPAPENPEVPAE
jgi:hypothetical protein